MDATQANAIATPGSLEELREWTRQALGEAARVPPAEMDLSRSIDQLGLSSLHVVRLAGDLEERLGIDIDPVSFYEFRTVDELCEGLWHIREARRGRGGQQAPTRLALLVGTSFTGTPLKESMARLIAWTGLPLQVRLAPYEPDCARFLQAQASAGAGTGIGLLVVRAQDWSYTPHHQAACTASIAAVSEAFIDRLRAARARAGIPLLLVLPPHGGRLARAPDLAWSIEEIDQALVDAARTLAGVHVLDLRRGVLGGDAGQLLDEAAEELGHIPYTAEGFDALAVAVVRRCAAMLGAPASTLVLDGAGTLWATGGSSGGDTSPRSAQALAPLREFVRQQGARGRRLALYNEDADARAMAAFAAQPDAPVTLDHFATHCAGAAAPALMALASRLQVPLEDVIFASGAASTIEAVRTALPQVQAVSLPGTPRDIGAYLRHHWAFDRPVPAPNGRSDDTVARWRVPDAAMLDAIADAGEDLGRLGARLGARTQPRPDDHAAAYATPRTVWEKRLCGIWRRVLQVERVGIRDTFGSLGATQAHAAEVLARLEEAGVRASAGLQLDGRTTVERLGAAVEASLAGGAAPGGGGGLSLAEESMLPPGIAVGGYDVTRHTTPMRRVLLTGATGFLGAYLLHELVRQTDAHILCAVRAASAGAGWDRVLANLRRHGLETPALKARVSVVACDLEQADLGLGEPAFQALARDIDTIIHGAAKVNFIQCYEELKAANVDATRNLLRLASADAPRAIAFHLVSTMGATLSAAYGHTRPLLETEPLVHGDDLLNGYEQSKFVSDRMAWIAMRERGIPAAIYRPGLIGGASDGTYHQLGDMLAQALKGCLQLGSMPLLETPWELAPVDFVAKAIVHIARQPRNLNRAYYVMHPQPCTLADYGRWHRRAGFRVRALPWPVWKQELLDLQAQQAQANALSPLMDLVRTVFEAQVRFPRIDNSHFRQATADLDFQPEPVMTLLDRYTRHFVRCGFYDDVPNLPPAWRALRGA